MLLAAQLAAAALAAGCPSNVANNLRSPPPPDSQQLITVEAASTRTTYATARIWRRSGACWAAAGGPYTARVGANGLRVNRREGDEAIKGRQRLAEPQAPAENGGRGHYLRQRSLDMAAREERLDKRLLYREVRAIGMPWPIMA